jgi:hypothetical protein
MDIMGKRVRALCALLNGTQTAKEWDALVDSYGPSPMDRLIADLQAMDDLEDASKHPHHFTPNSIDEMFASDPDAVDYLAT